MKYDRGAFFSEIKEALFGSFDQGQVDGLTAILDEAEARGTSVFSLSYMLATTYHETATTMQPISEYGGKKYFTKLYDIRGSNKRLARALGNTTPGDGARYHGRGYVQLTGKDNYIRAGKKLGVSLVNKPELALVLKHAVKIMFDGMTEGWFTGKKLGDYEGYYSSRKIINGLDKATVIASYADKFEEAVEHSLEQGSGISASTSQKVGHTKDGTPFWLAIITGLTSFIPFIISLIRKK